MSGIEENDDRRQLLIRSGRYAMLGGLSILSINLIQRVVNAGCVRFESPCQTCGLFEACELPKAAESRQSATGDEAS